MCPKFLFVTFLLCLIVDVVFTQERSINNDVLVQIAKQTDRIIELENQLLDLQKTKKRGIKKVAISFGTRFTPFKEIGVTSDDCGCPNFRIGEEQFYFDDFPREKEVNIKNLWLRPYETNDYYEYYHEYGYIGGNELPNLFKKTGFYEQNIRASLFFNNNWFVGLEAGVGKYTYGAINTTVAYSNGNISDIQLIRNDDFEYFVGRISAELAYNLNMGNLFSLNPSVGIGFPYQFSLGLSPRINIPLNKTKQQSLFVSLDARYYHQWVDKNIVIYNSLDGTPSNNTGFRFINYDFVNTSNRLYYGLSLGYEFGL